MQDEVVSDTMKAERGHPAVHRLPTVAHAGINVFFVCRWSEINGSGGTGVGSI